MKMQAVLRWSLTEPESALQLAMITYLVVVLHADVNTRFERTVRVYLCD